MAAQERRYSTEEAADRAGVEPAYFGLLASHHIVGARADGPFSDGDVRRATAVRTLTDAGVSVEALETAIANGAVSLDFFDSPVYERFAALGRETFRDVSARTGIPIDSLMLVREVMGSPAPGPDGRVRENELQLVPFLDVCMRAGIGLAATERLLRVMGDSIRRVAETEALWYFSEVMTPRITAGDTDQDLERELEEELAAALDHTVMAIYHAQQAQTWMGNIVRGVGTQLEGAGLHTLVERPPAICFLDITGYTRLTQERGDAAAAELAERLANLVQRNSVQRGGRPIKWLGDGVMFYFADAGPSVVAALEMVSGVSEAGLPPAHVGIHCGPVHFQQGDYFGQTVNLASRIAEFARPGEVLVSQEVVDAAESDERVAFRMIGPVELKGVSGSVVLYSADTAVTAGAR